MHRRRAHLQLSSKARQQERSKIGIEEGTRRRAARVDKSPHLISHMCTHVTFECAVHMPTKKKTKSHS
jgi:hypothetical protein